MGQDFGTNEGLIGSFVELLLYGMYVPIAMSCMVIFRKKYRAGKVHNYQLATFIALTLLCTARLIIDTNRTYVTMTKPLPDGTHLYGALDSPQSLATNAIWVIETVVADAFIIFRVWVVWSRKWWIAIFPTLLLIGNAICGMFIVYVMSTQSSATGGAFPRHLKLAGDLFSSTTLAVNLLCTCLICLGIWLVRRGVSSTRMLEGVDPVQRLVNMIIESAAIYSALLAVILATAGSFISFIFLDMVPPTIAIVFSTIILRSNQGRTFETHSTGLSNDDSRQPNSSSGTSRQAHTGPLFELRGRTESSESRKTYTPVQVQLDRVVTVKADESEVRSIRSSGHGHEEV